MFSLDIGGPYKTPFVTYREFGCIPDATYAFTIFDSGADDPSTTVSSSLFVSDIVPIPYYDSMIS